MMTEQFATTRYRLQKMFFVPALYLTAALLAAGCAGGNHLVNQRGGGAGYRQPGPVQAAQPTAAALTNKGTGTADARDSGEGSLWNDNAQLGRMFLNPKAHAIGDIVTIKIVETASASNKASTSTGRASSMDAGITAFFGLENDYPATRGFFNPFGKVGGSIDSTFDGSGSTARSGALNAFMTARVVDILENGNLIIQGNREVLVNHENQVITLTGIIRPRDISAENIVQSTYIADARIAYSGNGILNDRQQPGWLTRIMDKVWPF